MVDGSRGVLVLFAAIAAASDLRSGKVPNALLFPTLLFGILLRILAGEASLLPDLALQMLLTVCVLYPFWQAGGLGAGDIKMLAVLSVFMDREEYLVCAAVSFLTGGVYALFLLFRHRDLHRSIPFAVPIGTGVLFCLLFGRAGAGFFL